MRIKACKRDRKAQRVEDFSRAMSEIEVDGGAFDKESGEIFLTAFVVIFIGCVVGGICYFICAIIEFLKEFTSDEYEGEAKSNA